MPAITLLVDDKEVAFTTGVRLIVAIDDMMIRDDYHGVDIFPDTLQLVLTHEGLIVDLVAGDRVVGTCSDTYDELARRTK